MIINTTNYLRTFTEFNLECLKVFPNFYEVSIIKNWTMQDHAGWTEALYEAQVDNQVIEYMQTRAWKYHFNGVIGFGASLTDAIKDHKIKYEEHMRVDYPFYL